MQKGKSFHWVGRQTEKATNDICHVLLIDRNLNVFFNQILNYPYTFYFRHFIHISGLSLSEEQV